MVRCFVPTCKNRSKRNNIGQGRKISFHRFPKDPAVRLSWFNILNIDGLLISSTPYICSDHFKKEDYDTKTSLCRLFPDALPIGIHTQKECGMQALSGYKTVIKEEIMTSDQVCKTEEEIYGNETVIKEEINITDTVCETREDVLFKTETVIKEELNICDNVLETEEEETYQNEEEDSPRSQTGGYLTIEQRICIKFCYKLGKTAMEIYEMLKAAFDKDAPSRAVTFKWYKCFKNGRESLEDDATSATPVNVWNK